MGTSGPWLRGVRGPVRTSPNSTPKKAPPTPKKDALSLERLVAGLSHEINNPAAAVLTNLHVLRDDLGKMRKIMVTYRTLLEQARDSEITRLAERRERELDIPEVEQEMEEVVLECFDAMERIRQVLSNVQMLGDHPSDKQPIQIKALIEKAIQWMREQVSSSVALHADGVSDLEVRAVPLHIEQILASLLTNAHQANLAARGPGGTIAVSCVRNEQRCLIRITDQGSGMSGEELADCFEPRRVLAGRGSGLALMVTREVVALNGGELTVESRAGSGTSFILSFPALAPAVHIDD
jgi:signal transduction histidine kinase